MSTTLVQTESRRPAAVTGALSQASTASTVVVTGSDMDATQFASVSYTIKVITNDVGWSVFGANVSDFTDEVAVQAATQVVAGAAGSYSVAQAPFRYYRVKVIDQVGGSHGTATVNGVRKG